MSWREDLGRVEFGAESGASRRLVGATFRGVPFFVESAEFSGGRRGVTHEYPLRDKPYREDLGRKARGFNVEGYVLGDDYLERKSALLEVLEMAGPGELRHPYYGALTVAVSSVNVRESTAEGGVARFSISFEETGIEPVQPTSTPDVAGTLRAAAKVARTVVSGEFLRQYNPGAQTASLAGLVRSATRATDEAASRVTLSTQGAAAMRRRLDMLAQSAGALVASPSRLLASLTELFDGFGAGAWQALMTLYGFPPGARPPATTPNRRKEQQSFDAARLLTQRLAVVRAAELVVDETFATYEDAIAAREAILAALDEQAEVVSDDAYPALVQLRADVVKAVPSPDTSLPRLLPYSPGETTPSLVLAYQLYGDLSLEADVIARNRVANPGFIVGGSALQVLSNG